MCLQFVSLVTVSSKTSAAVSLAFLVRGYKLRNAWESIGAGRNIVTEIDQQVTRTQRRCIATDRHCHVTFVGARSRDTVRHKTAVTKGPQQFVDAFRSGLILRVYVDRIVESIGFLGKTAGKNLPCLFARLTQDVEIDSRHRACQGRAPQRASKNSDNIGTGLPVAPFF